MVIDSRTRCILIEKPRTKSSNQSRKVSNELSYSDGGVTGWNFQSSDWGFVAMEGVARVGIRMGCGTSEYFIDRKVCVARRLV